jgi:serine/threonine-protein kinase
LYLRELNSADPVPIKGTEGGRQPFFSPDGKWIGFWANGKLRKVPRQGGIAADLLKDPYPPKGAFWSEDGTILLGGEGGGLRRIPADGGAAEILTRIDPKRDVEHTLPFLLPDGKTVLFTATPDFFGNRARVEAVALGGGTRQVLIDDAADARYVPTGHIVFVRQGVLMAARFAPSRLEVGPPFPLVQGVEQALNVGAETDHSGAGQFSVSATGSLAYAVGGVGHFLENELVWVSRDGRAEALAGFDRSDVANQGQLSPDGRQLAFVQQAGPLWLFDVARATTRRLSDDGVAAGPR